MLLLFCGLAGPLAAAASEDDIPPMARKVKGFDTGLLAAVDGVTFRQYGQISYLHFYDPKAEEGVVLERLHLTKDRYDNAKKIFGERMRDDPTRTMVNLFGAYFNEAAQGPFAALGRDVAISVLDDVPLKEQPPMSEEKFREIQIYYGRKASVAGTGLDKQDDVLKPYGITFNDFNILGAWFSRRLALEARRDDDDDDRPQRNYSKPRAPVQHAEWGGLWRFSWRRLKRGTSAMEVEQITKDICLKADMTAETLPVMPKPPNAKCVIINGIRFFDTEIGVRMQCDHGPYGTEWGLNLFTPIVNGKSYSGTISVNMENELVSDLPNPDTAVSAERIGDCK